MMVYFERFEVIGVAVEIDLSSMITFIENLIVTATPVVTIRCTLDLF
jgi:hypothetical protein